MTDARPTGYPADGTGATGRTGGTSRTSLRAGTTRAHRRRDDRPRALTLGGAVDGLVLAAMLGVTALGFGPAWGTTDYLLPALGGAALGLAVAWTAAALRWPVLLTAGVAVLAFFVAGGALALPATTVAGVVPTPETWQLLAVESVRGWKAFVTTVPPLSSFPELAVVPYLLMTLTGVLAGTCAWRARQAAWALVPVTVTFAAVALLGTILPAQPLVQGLVVGVVGLLWASWRAVETRMEANRLLSDASRDATRRLRAQRVRGGAVMLALGGVAAVLVAPGMVAGQERVVLREIVTPPLDLHQYTSPLVAFRGFTKDQADTTLFTVTGMPEGARVRLATLDEYAGTVYDVASGGGSGVFNRAGEVIDTVAEGTRTTIEVEVGGYDGVWLPDVGELAGIRFTGDRAETLQAATYYNGTSGTGLVTAGLRPGDTYELDAIVTRPPDEDALATVPIEDVDLPAPKDVADAVPAKAAQFAAEATEPFQQLTNIRDVLVATGVYSSGLDNQPPSLPGHSAARIDALLSQDEMVGDDEQFATALALLARQVGVPARVVMGFYPDEKTWEPGTPYVVTGADVHAWVEVPFEGYGWVPFDVVPDEDNKVEPLPRSRQVPKPPVLEDPETPEEPPQAEAGDVEDEDKDEEDAETVDWRQVALVAMTVGIPLLVLAAPLLAILLFKARRLRRRRTAPVAVDRVSGGWRQVLDTATDLGAAVPGAATRRESARLLAEQPATASAGATTTALAHRADQVVFGAGEPSDAETAAYWADVDTAVRDMQRSVPWGRRVRARFSLRSVRGADAPPLRTVVRDALTFVPRTIGRGTGAVASRLRDRMARTRRRRQRAQQQEDR